MNKISEQIDVRVILCEACGSEGRILTSNGGPYDNDYGECKVCDGRGFYFIETQPIEMDDLDAAG